ncbi:hypothetical protein HUG17_0434 [Dermatophagoides farinae]|uniref:Uncharacterized protein n=1 Tax=Dermatophagoides farinae TaxID=6954 RepID=A0A9D4P613_DERFA|nr:hypothetical protein HUG17_0434 [Dermatophagoides farinae]
MKMMTFFEIKSWTQKTKIHSEIHSESEIDSNGPFINLFLHIHCQFNTLAVNPDELAESGRAMAIILGTLTEEDANLVMSSHNPEEMLDLLRRKYEGSKSASIMALKGDFHTIKFDDQLSFFGKIRDINSKLKALGSELDEVDMCQRVLAILPPEHQDIVGQVRVMSEFNMDHGDIDLKLVKIESLLRQRIKDRDSGISIAKHSNDALNKSVTFNRTKCLATKKNAVTKESRRRRRKKPLNNYEIEFGSI